VVVTMAGVLRAYTPIHGVAALLEMSDLRIEARPTLVFGRVGAFTISTGFLRLRAVWRRPTAWCWPGEGCLGSGVWHGIEAQRRLVACWADHAIRGGADTSSHWFPESIDADDREIRSGGSGFAELEVPAQLNTTEGRFTPNFAGGEWPERISGHAPEFAALLEPQHPQIAGGRNPRTRWLQSQRARHLL